MFTDPQLGLRGKVGWTALLGAALLAAGPGHAAGTGKSAQADLAILENNFGGQPVTIMLKNAGPGTTELTGVRITNAYDLLGARFLRLQGAKGETILLRGDIVLSIRASGHGVAFVLDGPDNMTVRPGDEVTLKVVIERKSGFAKAVTLAVSALPKGIQVTPMKATIDPGDTTAIFALRVAKDAPPSERRIRITAEGGDAVAEASWQVRVEKR